jgi:hypothetical protein
MRLDRLLATLRARADSGDRVQLCAGQEPPLDLAHADRDQIMDALSAASGAEVTLWPSVPDLPDTRT